MIPFDEDGHVHLSPASNICFGTYLIWADTPNGCAREFDWELEWQPK